MGNICTCNVHNDKNIDKNDDNGDKNDDNGDKNDKNDKNNELSDILPSIPSTSKVRLTISIPSPISSSIHT